MLLLITFDVMLAFIINLTLTVIIIHISHRNKWYDHHDDRKIHTSLTPRLGGIGIFLSFILSSLIITFFLPQTTNFVPARFLANRDIPLFAGFMLVHIIGIVDDLHNIRAIYKLCGQILAGALVILGGALIDGIYIPIARVTIPLGPLSGAITIFWLISISNAVNFIDGMDGLAGSTVLIASGGIGLVHTLIGNITGAMYSFVLFGCSLGLFWYLTNRLPEYLWGIQARFLWDLFLVPLHSLGPIVLPFILSIFTQGLFLP